LKTRLLPSDSQFAELQFVGVISGRYNKTKGLLKLNPVTLFPCTITDVKVHGKFIYLVGKPHYIGFTLGMTGNFSPEQSKYARLRFTFANTGDVFFVDIRNFGTVKQFTQKELEHKLDYLGIDPLQNTIDFRDMATLLTLHGHLTLAEFLMDQRLIAGIGNYLKAEILWHACLSPHRLASSLNSDDVSNLTSAINKVPRVSFENQGASIRNYVTPTQAKGKFSELFEVYQHKIDRHGNTVVKETTRDNRSTFWAPAWQR
jgi:formamidopyrimidine-DNA glycosylase